MTHEQKIMRAHAEVTAAQMKMLNARIAALETANRFKLGGDMSSRILVACPKCWTKFGVESSQTLEIERRIAALEAANAELEAEHNAARKEMKQAQQRAFAYLYHVKRLEKLRQYVKHTDGCASWNGEPTRCNCGLLDVLQHNAKDKDGEQ